VHGAVNNNGVDALLVTRRDGGDPLLVEHIGEALVVDNNIVAVSPLGVIVDRYLGVFRGAALVDDCPLDVGPLGDLRFEYFGLERVVGSIRR